jgi:hypothetical protein
VTPKLPDTLAVIGRIGSSPKMLVVGDAAVAGLSVEPLAVSHGDALFVEVVREDSTYAGEALIGGIESAPLSPGAPPEEVLAAFFRALKVGDEETWRGFFVTWDATIAGGRPWYRPFAGPAEAALSREWLRARGVLDKIVHDIRVLEAGEIVSLFRGDEFDGAPAIDQVLVETDQIGLFDGEYRAFKDLHVNRLWKLQRRDGGPWRVVTEKGV